MPLRCDGSHNKLASLPPASQTPTIQSHLPTAMGLLTVTPVPNGPLKVDGAMEIVSGTGRTIDRRNSAFLCRCGASANKPFCDGSHSKVSFTDTERRTVP
jgi:CDGSH-type Zn-finger protein